MATIECENCGGAGLVLVDYHNPNASDGHGQSEVTCGECDGTGEINTDEDELE